VVGGVQLDEQDVIGSRRLHAQWGRTGAATAPERGDVGDLETELPGERAADGVTARAPDVEVGRTPRVVGNMPIGDEQLTLQITIDEKGLVRSDHLDRWGDPDKHQAV
jgi:hypothetical protein